MTRTELVEELERLLGEAAVARERLEGVLGAVRALRQGLPASGRAPTTTATGTTTAPSPAADQAP